MRPVGLGQMHGHRHDGLAVHTGADALRHADLIARRRRRDGDGIGLHVARTDLRAVFCFAILDLALKLGGCLFRYAIFCGKYQCGDFLIGLYRSAAGCTDNGDLHIGPICIR